MKSELLEGAATIHVLEKGRSLSRRVPRDANVAEVDTHITFDPDILSTFDYRGWQPKHYDLLVVCAAVEFADRSIRRPSTWCRKVNVCVPVLQPAVWQQKEVVENLQDALRHVTGDQWMFKFEQWRSTLTIGSRQGELSFGSLKKFAMAYSDGLDFVPLRH